MSEPSFDDTGKDARNNDEDIFFDDPEQFAGDSSLDLGEQPFDPNALKIYQTGEVTVVGIDGCEVPDDFCIAPYRDQLYELVDQNHCRTLKIDLSGVKLIPSGMLGLLISLRKHVERIVLCNPSPDIREVLQVSHLEKILGIQDQAEIPQT